MKYIALLRGINVGGQKKIKMADLKVMFESMGFKDVKTYIQSGNVIFNYDSSDTIILANRVEEKISETFGFSAKTIIRTAEELRSIIDNNPFIKEPDIELDKLHVTLMIDVPAPNIISSLNIKKEENERYLIISKEIYLYCPNGYGNTKLNNSIFEKKLNIAATTRNWKTITKLHEL